MSVINQVLLNLEKRRASPAERGLLPNHVQVLPESGPASYWRWIAAGVAFAIAAPAGWMALTATVAESARSATTRPGTESASESVVSTPGVHTTAARIDAPEDTHEPVLGAMRLSLELSSLPAEPVPGRGAGAAQAAGEENEPLSSARLIARQGTDSPADVTPSRGASASSSNAGRREAAAPAKPAKGGGATPEISKQMREPTPRELAENEYRKAVALLNQGRLAEAEEGFQSALDLYPENHQARQGLIGLLVQGKKFADAERVLEEGVKLSPAQSGFCMALARLQADRGDNAQAIATLQSGLEYARSSADYVAFLAALLQRQGRHEEAIVYFQAALQLRPRTGVWWLGLGMSLQAANRPADAQTAYQQARAAGNLHPELAALAEQRLRQLQ
jgi:MSHA biogenesis protein MshN